MTQDEMWLLKEKYNGEKTEGFFVDSARLRAGEPLAYIIGSIPFLGTTIYLDSHPLIPRPETEFWTEKIIAHITTHHPPYEGRTFVRVLDLCAGSGCIGVSILKAIPQAHVDFVEIDTAHHSTILKNIHENDIDESRTHILGGNLFENLTQKYDYILSNPPYIDPAIDRTDASVKMHEPHIALYGGNNGTELICKIIEESQNYLTENGVLVIEHEPEQVQILSDKAREVGFVADTRLDQYGVPRYTAFNRKLH